MTLAAVDNISGGNRLQQRADQGQAYTQAPALCSGIYSGWVRHRRYEPKAHRFSYAVFMMYLDLDEVEHVLAKSFWWSTSRWALARFKLADYLGDKANGNASIPALKSHVCNLVERELNVVVDGRIRMLTNLRYFGFIINPITIYYCHDRNENLVAMVLEVTNTPWKNRHQYVLRCDPEKAMQRISFNKALHVSPFHPMNMYYHLRSNRPSKTAVVHLSNHMGKDVHKKNEQPVVLEAENLVFDATLLMSRQEISSTALARVLLTYPFMTIKVCLAIYWQATKLLIKRVPFFAQVREGAS